MNSTDFITDSNDIPLPKDWEMRVDDRTGLPYYLNHMDQYTTWDDPRKTVKPRKTLNNMASMLYPDHGQRRGRCASVEPNSLLDRFQSQPEEFSHFHTLGNPRRSTFKQRLSDAGGFRDDWFNDGFRQLDRDFFEPSFPVHRSTRARSVQPSWSQSSYSSPNQSNYSTLDDYSNGDDYTIPIKCESSDYKGPAKAEIFIVPTQLKKDQPTKPEDPKENNSNKGPQQIKKVDLLSTENSIQSDSGSRKHELTTENKQEGSNKASERESANSNPATEPPVRIIIDECDAPSPERTGSKRDDDIQSNQNDNNLTKDQQEEDFSENKSDDSLMGNILKSHQAIQAVLDDLENYIKPVNEFAGEKGSKDYRYLEEMLTRCQLSLDNVDTYGDDSVRKHRKDTVNQIESLIKLLENKAVTSVEK